MSDESKVENEFAKIAEEEINPHQVDQQDIPPMDTTDSGNDDPFTASTAGKVYDFNNAPDTVRAPERILMDGAIVEITQGELIIPPLSWKWDKSKKGTKESKACPFKIHMKTPDGKLQIENYSGVKVFKSDDGKYSPPSIWKDGTRKTQAYNLMNAYAKFSGKDIKEVTLKQFGTFLNSGVVYGKIAVTDFENPETDEIVQKNIIVEFVNKP